MQKLFSEFKPVTAADWKNQIIKDLKGEPFEQLIWHNENGFDIQPFYTSEDLKQTYDPAFTHASWEICVNGTEGSDKEQNTYLLESLNQGATAISLDLRGRDVDAVLKTIQLNHIASSFFVDQKSAVDLITYLKQNYKLEELNCSILPAKVESITDLENYFKSVQELAGLNIRTWGLDFFSIHNLNCFAYYEVAVIISGLVELLEFFSAKKVMLASSLVVKTGVSTDYFVQMAKLRAIRRLWKLFKEEYGIKNDLHLITETSLTNKSISDNYNNLLRTTVEAMAAVSGGCNELIVSRFDLFIPGNGKLPGRMAVNQQSILKEESYLDKVADVGCGSYYLEALTDAIAKKALEAFKGFEKQGGYLKCLEKAIFNKEIEAQARQKEEFISTHKQLVIGVTKFKNEKEKINLSAARMEELKKWPVHNPVLNFELEHYFNLKNA